MTRTPLRLWVGGGLLVVGAPVLSGCNNPQYYPADCDRLVRWDGGLADGGAPGDAGLDSATCQLFCNNLAACSIADGGLIRCLNPCVGGRAPPGLLALSAVDGSAGSFISRMAELETAAIRAFAQLAEELHAHGLAQFATYAWTAAAQEVRHAQEVTRLALHFGHCPTPQSIEPTPLRSLGEIALDNAGEGCGRELLGAAINAYQAKSATDPRVRQTMASIAADETAHADFSFELARALMPRLTVAQRRLAREAQEQTLVQMSTDAVPATTRALLGLMDGEQLAVTTRRLLERAHL